MGVDSCNEMKIFKFASVKTECRIFQNLGLGREMGGFAQGILGSKGGKTPHPYRPALNAANKANRTGSLATLIATHYLSRTQLLLSTHSTCTVDPCRPRHDARAPRPGQGLGTTRPPPPPSAAPRVNSSSPFAPLSPTRRAEIMSRRGAQNRHARHLLAQHHLAQSGAPRAAPQVPAL